MNGKVAGMVGVLAFFCFLVPLFLLGSSSSTSGGKQKQEGSFETLWKLELAEELAASTAEIKKNQRQEGLRIRDKLLEETQSFRKFLQNATGRVLPALGEETELPSLVNNGDPKVELLPCPRTSGKFVTVTRAKSGLGDRFKAMTNGFITALLSGRGLMISNEVLADSGHTVEASTCKWQEKLPAMPNRKTWSFDVLDTRREGPFTDKDFKFFESHPVWDIRSNMVFSDELLSNPDFAENPLQLHLAKMHSEGKLFHFALRSLIKPSESIESVVQQEIDKLDPGHDHYLIGFHLRAGDKKMGARRKREHEEGNKYRFTHPQQFRMLPEEGFPCFAQEGLAVWEELSPEEQRKYPGGPLFFVSSDFPTGAKKLVELLADAGHTAFELSSFGPVRHSNLGGEQTRTYIDWWVLTKCKQLVITVSGFSETAAKYNCVPTRFFVNHPTLKNQNEFKPRQCVHHFIRMRGDGLCTPETDDDFLFEYTFYRYT